MIADTKFDAGKKRSNETLQCCQLAGKKLVSTKKIAYHTIYQFTNIRTKTEIKSN